jgi:hypothetical protein
MINRRIGGAKITKTKKYAKYATGAIEGAKAKADKKKNRITIDKI